MEVLRIFLSVFGKSESGLKVGSRKSSWKGSSESESWMKGLAVGDWRREVKSESLKKLGEFGLSGVGGGEGEWLGVELVDSGRGSSPISTLRATSLMTI